MKVSICSFSFFNSFKEGTLDIFNYLESMKYRYDLDTADIWNGFICNIDLPLLHVPDESYLYKIRQSMDERGLTLANFAIDGAHIWDPMPGMREKLYQSGLDHLRAAEILGAKTVRIDTGGDYHAASEMSEEQFEYIVRRYQEFCERGKENGYKIGPENHMGPSLNPHALKKIATAVNHPNFGVLLHLGRWRKDPEEGDALLAPWAAHTHFDKKTILADNAVEKIKMLLDHNYSGYWGIEYNAENNQHEEITALVARFKDLLKQVVKTNNI